MNTPDSSQSSAVLLQRVGSAIEAFIIAIVVTGCVQILHEKCLGTCSAQKGRATNFASDELLVKFKPGTDLSTIQSVNEELRVKVLKVLSGGQVYLVKIPADSSLDEVRRAYTKSPNVQSVELNYTAVAQ